jgi:hypothetical protein
MTLREAKQLAREGLCPGEPETGLGQEWQGLVPCDTDTSPGELTPWVSPEIHGIRDATLISRLRGNLKTKDEHPVRVTKLWRKPTARKNVLLFP